MAGAYPRPTTLVSHAAPATGPRAGPHLNGDPRDTNYDQIQAGWSAHGRDGDKIGDIEEVGQNYLLVTKGLFMPKDLFIPLSTIQSVEAEEGRVILDVAKSQVDDMGWDQPPEADDTTYSSDQGAVSASGSAWTVVAQFALSRP